MIIILHLFLSKTRPESHMIIESFPFPKPFSSTRKREKRNNLNKEKMKGQRGRLPDQPLGYVMSTKVSCFSQGLSSETSACRPTSVWCLKEKQKFHVMADEVSLRTRARQNCMRTSRKTDFRWVKNNLHGHDISRPTPRVSLSVSSFSLAWIKLLNEVKFKFLRFKERFRRISVNGRPN